MAHVNVSALLWVILRPSFFVINGWRMIGLRGGGGGTVILVRNFGSFKVELNIHFCVGVFSWHF